MRGVRGKRALERQQSEAEWWAQKAVAYRETRKAIAFCRRYRIGAAEVERQAQMANAIKLLKDEQKFAEQQALLLRDALRVQSRLF